MIDEVLSISNVSEYYEEWILDSGASHHICPNRNWFTSYQAVDSGVVLMGNDNSCNTIGVGSVKIKMFDGVIRTLTNVRHVPELKKNLISLGVLDSGGHEFTGQGGELQVFKGSLMVMKARKVGNLYKLEGKMKQVKLWWKASAPTCLWH
jgi:hypothetical protein